VADKIKRLCRLTPPGEPTPTDDVVATNFKEPVFPEISDPRIKAAAIDTFWLAIATFHSIPEGHELAMPADFDAEFMMFAERALKVWRQYNDPHACASCGLKVPHDVCRSVCEGEQLPSAAEYPKWAPYVEGLNPDGVVMRTEWEKHYDEICDERSYGDAPVEVEQAEFALRINAPIGSRV
jgi:hypothetical protein